MSEYVELDSKSVLDSDGFYTDYTLYRCEDEYGNLTYVCVFGDKDLYTPEDSEYDFESEDEDEAYEWFESYEGFEDDDDVYSSSKINSSEDDDWTKLSGSDQTAVEYAVDLIRNGVNPESAVYRACETVAGGNAEPEYEEEEFYQDEPDIDAVMNYVMKNYGGVSSAKDTCKECVTASYHGATDIVQDMYRKYPKFNFIEEESFPEIDGPGKVRLYFDGSKWPVDMEECTDYLKSKGLEVYWNHYKICVVADEDENIEECEGMKKAKITASIDDLRNKINNKVDEEVIMLEENIMHDVEAAIPEYNPDWCAEDLQFKYEEAREAFINSMVDDILLAYYSEEEA